MPTASSVPSDPVVSTLLCIVLLTAAAVQSTTAFFPSFSQGRLAPLDIQPNGRIQPNEIPNRLKLALFASKKKSGNKKKKGGSNKKPAMGGGGFGGAKTAASDKRQDSGMPKAARADKNSLETQWDNFASITDLEIRPLGDPDDDDYEHFAVADVFVRSGNGQDDEASGTGWFRIGKVCIAREATLEAALTLQKGLIFWTAVHMRRELMALGKASATSLELGYSTPAIVYMGSETDGPVEKEDEDMIQVFATKASPEVLRAITDPSNSYGFRPDWNPPGFTYKRRENAARKKKQSSKLGDMVA